MRLSTRIQEVAPSPSFAVSAEVARLRREGRTIIDFGVGELDFPTVSAAKRAAKEAIDADQSRYTPTPGTAELRKAVAAWHAKRHGSHVEAPDVVAGAGAKALLFELLQVLVEPGDDVVVQSPYWVSFPAQVSLAGGRLVPAAGDASDGFVPRAEQVRRVITERTSVVLMNSPCNPTGAVMPREEVRELVRLCAERGVALVLDEVYDRLVFDGEHVSPLVFADLHPGGIACVGSASKTFAMTGWRLGYLVAPGDIAAAVARLQGHVTSCPSSISQAAAAAAFVEGEDEVETMVERLRSRRDLAMRHVESAAGLSCHRPAGTFFLFPRVDLGCGGEVDSQAVAVHLLRHAGVAVVPGTAFGLDGHVRISHAVEEGELERGMEALCREVERLRADPGRLGRS